MSLRNLYSIICILLCFAFLSCASKDQNSLKQPVDNNHNNLEEFFKAIVFLDAEGVSDYLNNGFDANAKKDDKTALMLAVITPYFVPSQADKENISSGKMSREDIINERRRQIIQNLIDKGANINTVDKNKKTALMLTIVITEKSYDYRESLLGIEVNVSEDQKIFDPDSQYHNLDVWTTKAPQASTMQIFEVLIEAGIDVNIADRYGRTSLMLVAESFFDTTKVTRMLIDAGADVDMTDKRGRTVLIQTLVEIEKVLELDGDSIRRAILAGMIEILIESGAKLNATDTNDRTALELILALLNRDIKLDAIMPILVDSVDLNNISLANRNNLILHIFRSDDNNAVKALFEKDTDINIVDEDGRTPLLQLLELAQQEFIPNIVKMVKSLIEAGEDVNVENGKEGRYKGWTPLMFASSLPWSQSYPQYKLDIVKILLEARADPKARDERHWSVLMIASANLHPDDPASEDIVEELLKNEADPNIVNHLWTALMFASRSGSINAVKA